MNESFISSSGQSNSYGDLTENMKTMKRNKAFWRFSKSEDLLEGMGMWKHRDLLPIDGEDDTQSPHRSQYSKKQLEKNIPKNDFTLVKKNSKDKSQEERVRANDNELYDEAPKKRNHSGPHIKEKNAYKEIQDTNFYDDDDEVLLRTVKRKEILKQYHSSETDTEISINSDPYDCIMQKSNNTLLPRTKLSKSKNESYDLTLKSTSSAIKTKSYEPWRNF